MTLRSRVFAATYDWQMKKVERVGLRALRAGLLSTASGRVLEIGAGTGGNLAFYGPGVESLTLTEPERPMLSRLERRVRESASPASVLRAPAEDLPFDDDSFDVAVSTLVLCGVSDQPRALRALRRVLRPGGQLVFIEHVRSDEARLARRQDRLNGLNRFMVGCDCNRATVASIEAAGFEITHLEHRAMPKVPAYISPFVAGRAVAPAAA